MLSVGEAWSWAPKEGVCALALMPDDVANADRGDTSPLPGAPEDPVVAELAKARSVDVLEFVELGGDMTLEAARSLAPLRTASERIFFGSTPLYYGPGYYIDRPDHARDLYESTRQAYGHLLFPVPPPPERPFYQYVLMPWLPFWDVLRFLSRWIPRQVRNAVRLMKAGRTQLLPQILGRLSQIGAQLSRMRPRR